MFEAVCSTDNPVEVWCMFKKSEVNVSSFAAVIGVGFKIVLNVKNN